MASALVRRKRRVLLWLLPLTGFCLALWLGAASARVVPDASWYRLLALGQNGLVRQPFSARVLAPAAAAELAKIPGGSIDRGFLWLGIFCLAVLLLLVYTLITWRRALSRRECAALCAAVFLMPFWIVLFHGYYLPDLPSAAILALLLWCLLRERIVLAMLLLFPAYLARESTSLVAVCLIFAAWRRIPRKAAIVGAVAVICGLAASMHFEALGLPSKEGAHGAAYLLGKVIWNLPRNTIGLTLWTSTQAVCQQPVWAVDLPHWLHLGAIHRAGICGFSSWGPVRLLLAWFGMFGVGPAVAIALLPRLFSHASMTGRDALAAPATGQGNQVRSHEAPSHQGPIIVYRFALIYGAISILLTPALGASVDRLVAYGWPLFFVALPWALHTHFPAVRPRGWWILAAHLASCWIAWFAFRGTFGSRPVMAVAAVLVLNILTWFLVDRTHATTPSGKAAVPA